MKKPKHGERAPPAAAEPAEEAAAQDPRFAAVQTNPRFARFPKAKARVEIDQRFAGVFSDPKFKRQTVVDKRGRATAPSEREDDLRRFYRLHDEDEEAPEKAHAADSASASSSDDEEAAPDAARGLARGRGLRGSVSVSSSSSDEGDEEEDSGEEGVLAQFVSGQDDIEHINETHRLAVVDLEWDRIRAVDLLAVLRSFLPSGGRIVRVTVYPSDFGLARMQEEEAHGPRGAFADEDDSDEDGDAAANGEKLRQYERERLRFYYAIVECDCAATAAALYQQCDGLEFERSSTRLDLRYVPDEQSFAGREPRDSATAVPAEYAPVDYTTKALQQTRVTLTWDADDPERKKHLRRKLTAEQLRDEDFAAYLGSGSEEEADDEKQKAEAARLRSKLLGGGGGVGGDDDGAADGGRAPRAPRREGDMVVTFGNGLEERLAAKRAKASEPAETVWQAHLRERKEKKRAGKAKVAAPADGEVADDDGGGAAADLGFNDPFFAAADDAGARPRGGGEERTRRKKQRVLGGAAGEDASADGAASREEARRRAELELLLMDDARLKAGAAPLRGTAHAVAPAGDDAPLSRKQARLAAKAAKRAAREARLTGGGPDGPALDTADARFAALFERPEFALDPTDSRFKAVRSVDTIRRESAARRAAPASAAAACAAPRPAADGAELGSAVARLKRKAGARL